MSMGHSCDNDEEFQKERAARMGFPVVDQASWFYRNCKRQRRNMAKICDVCPFRKGIEAQEETK
jgi:hypothetical protein